MRRSRMLAVLALVTPLAGCGCFRGGYEMTTVPQLRSAMHYDAGPVQPAPLRADVTLDYTRAEYRNPDSAFCLACAIAGGGHLYSGETVKGVALLGIAAGGLIGGAVLSSGDGSDDPLECDYDIELHECRDDDGSKTPLLVGAGIAAASWIYGILDSRASAERMNARNGIQLGDARVGMQPVLDASRGQPRAGMQFRVTF